MHQVLKSSRPIKNNVTENSTGREQRKWSSHKTFGIMLTDIYIFNSDIEKTF